MAGWPVWGITPSLMFECFLNISARPTPRLYEPVPGFTVPMIKFSDFEEGVTDPAMAAPFARKRNLWKRCNSAERANFLLTRLIITRLLHRIIRQTRLYLSGLPV
jgi:hypothetical protein